jgi:flagellar protein FliT
MSFSMSSMPGNIELYEEIRALSARMVGAAQCAQWDELVELEQRIAALRDSMLHTDDDTLSPADAQRKRLLIQGILADDAEVRRHTEPWMEHVRQFLGAGVVARRVSQAYQAAS